MDDIAEKAAAERLAALLTSLRKGKNLSQRELGRRAGISWTFVQVIERGVRTDSGRPVQPSPQSLQKIANGLAVNPLNREEKNPAVAHALFQRLMAARGWSTDDTAPAEPDEPTVEEVRGVLMNLAGADAGSELMNLAVNWFQLSIESRRLLMTTARYVTTREGCPTPQKV